MQLDEFAFMDATAQAELVRTGEVQAVELVDRAIHRIEQLNTTLNAVITPMFERAHQAAQGPLPKGPFRGVPFLLKDLIASWEGVRMTSGSRFLSYYVPAQDSELVTRLKETGVVILGKTNTPEFGIVPTTEPDLFGATRNPWNLDRMPGGSSGGSAAAVASGMVPMAHGNDGGGSIRIPASCCGLFGLKPTRARNPVGPEWGDIIGGLVCEHALTRSVRDSAALLDATCGAELGDPYWAPPPARPFLKEVGVHPGRLRIGFVTASPTEVEVQPDCLEAVRDAAKLCESLGHELHEINLAVDPAQITQAFITVWAAGVAWNIDMAAEMTGQTPTADKFETLTWALAELARQQTSAQYLMAVTMLQRIGRDLTMQIQPYDVVLTPTLPQAPAPLGSFVSPPENPLQGLLRSADFVPFTVVCNITGIPAMSVPLFWNADGLPIGSHFIARFGDEATLFQLAAQLEEARPWAEKRPPVSEA